MSHHPPETAAEPIEYCGVWIGAGELAEVDGGRTALAVRREDLDSARLCRGWQAERPWVLLGFGAILLALGLIPVPCVVLWLIHGGGISSTLPLLLIWLPFGGWALYRAASRGFYLAIRCHEGSRKLAFSRRADRANIEAFLKEAERRFGYAFQSDL
ncbi:MAG TPA: hypothetical protein PK280_12340 [Planctomycetota bacterium]|nr:hypothetical protein [Planctomycetota bacterium]